MAKVEKIKKPTTKPDKTKADKGEPNGVRVRSPEVEALFDLLAPYIEEAMPRIATSLADTRKGLGLRKIKIVVGYKPNEDRTGADCIPQVKVDDQPLASTQAFFQILPDGIIFRLGALPKQIGLFEAGEE